MAYHKCVGWHFSVVTYDSHSRLRHVYPLEIISSGLYFIHRIMKPLLTTIDLYSLFTGEDTSSARSRR